MRLRKVDVAKEPIVNCCFCGIASTSSACEEMFEVITSSRVPNHACNCCLDNVKHCPVVEESKEDSDARVDADLRAFTESLTEKRIIRDEVADHLNSLPEEQKEAFRKLMRIGRGYEPIGMAESSPELGNYEATTKRGMDVLAISDHLGTIIEMEERTFLGSIGGFANYDCFFTATTRDHSIRCRAFAGNSGVSCTIVSINEFEIKNVLPTLRVEEIDGCSIWVKIDGIHELLILDECGVYFEIQHEDGKTFITVNGCRAYFNVCEYFIGSN